MNSIDHTPVLSHCFQFSRQFNALRHPWRACFLWGPLSLIKTNSGVTIFPMWKIPRFMILFWKVVSKYVFFYMISHLNSEVDVHRFSFGHSHINLHFISTCWTFTSEREPFCVVHSIQLLLEVHNKQSRCMPWLEKFFLVSSFICILSSNPIWYPLAYKCVPHYC